MGRVALAGLIKEAACEKKLSRQRRSKYKRELTLGVSILGGSGRAWSGRGGIGVLRAVAGRLRSTRRTTRRTVIARLVAHGVKCQGKK